MSSKLIRLKDGTLVEIEVPDDEMSEVNDKNARDVSSSFDKVEPALIKACRPIAAAWTALSQEVEIEQAEVEIGFSFESEGNIYITKAKAASNLKVKLVLKPKSE
jgi:Trypsin-co-occurring domain 1